MLTVHVETFGWEEQHVHGLYMGSHVSLHVKTRVICNMHEKKLICSLIMLFNQIMFHFMRNKKPFHNSHEN